MKKIIFILICIFVLICFFMLIPEVNADTITLTNDNIDTFNQSTFDTNNIYQISSDSPAFDKLKTFVLKCQTNIFTRDKIDGDVWQIINTTTNDYINFEIKEYVFWTFNGQRIVLVREEKEVIIK